MPIQRFSYDSNFLSKIGVSLSFNKNKSIYKRKETFTGCKILSGAASTYSFEIQGINP